MKRDARYASSRLIWRHVPRAGARRHGRRLHPRRRALLARRISRCRQFVRPATPSERRVHPHRHDDHDGEFVLNARRHRSGEFRGLPIAGDDLLRCSTPEGIGAASSSSIKPWLAFLRCAQRPKASERRVPRRGSVQTTRRARAQRPKASERRVLRDDAPSARQDRTVLNARRHRSGEFQSFASRYAWSSACSTPEGIGAASSTAAKKSLRDILQCSTPEGIGAASSPKGTSSYASSLFECSTPEGIGAASTRQPLPGPSATIACSTPEGIGAASAWDRQGSGGRGEWCSTPEGIGAASSRDCTTARGRSLRCSTPEGIGAASSTAAATWSSRSRRAQRPKASERRVRVGVRTKSSAFFRAQRPKASERRVHVTAGGIGNRRGVLNARRHRSPKASERRVPRLRRRSGSLRLVLNARRHRSGEFSGWRRPTSRRSNVLNARRHRCGEFSATRMIPTNRRNGAQRPKASERRVQRVFRSSLGHPRPVLNARRHRSGEFSH